MDPAEILYYLICVVFDHSHPLWEERSPSFTGGPPDPDEEYVLSIDLVFDSVQLSH